MTVRTNTMPIVAQSGYNNCGANIVFEVHNAVRMTIVIEVYIFDMLRAVFCRWWIWSSNAPSVLPCSRTRREKFVLVRTNTFIFNT